MATNNDGAATVIGESMQVRGNLTGDEDLHVLGRVDGAVDLDRTLVVAKSGIVKAEVSVRNAVISGIVVGNVRASESVEVTKDGRMVGDIQAPRVIIVDGASFRGSVDMGDAGNMPARAPRSERRVTTPTTPPRRAEPRTETRADKTERAPVVERTEPETKKTETAPVDTPAKTVVTIPAQKKSTPAFLEPPPAKSLPKKQKHRVVVKRK